MDLLRKAGSRRRYVWDYQETNKIGPLALYALLNSSDSYLRLPSLFGSSAVGAQSNPRIHLSGMLQKFKRGNVEPILHTAVCSEPVLKESAFPILP